MTDSASCKLNILHLCDSYILGRKRPNLAAYVLKTHGVRCLHDLVDQGWTYTDLLAVPHIGPVFADRIEQVMQAHGLHLASTRHRAAGGNCPGTPSPSLRGYALLQARLVALAEKVALIERRAGLSPPEHPPVEPAAPILPWDNFAVIQGGRQDEQTG